MINSDEKSNAQNWELEITCKNKKYLDAVVKAVMKYGLINFQVEMIDVITNHKKFDGRYLVLMWCSWFNNLAPLAKDLKKIEDKFEKYD